MACIGGPDEKVVRWCLATEGALTEKRSSKKQFQII